MSAFRELEPTERRRLGQVGAVLFIVGSLTAIPAGFFLEPLPATRDHVVSLIGVLFGLLFFVLPWERLSSNWLHAIPIIGTIEVIAGVAIFGDDYAFFFVLGAIYVAYTVHDPRFLAAYMTLFVLALFSPLVYSDIDQKDQAHQILITLPVLVISAVMVRYLRDTLEKREDQYRVFASEAVALAERIRGQQPSVQRLSAEELGKRLDALSDEPAERL